MGTGVSTAPHEEGEDGGSETSRSRSNSRTSTHKKESTKHKSKLTSALNTIRRAGSSFKRQASARCHKFEKTYYKKRDPQYIDYSVYGEDEDANDLGDPRVYQLKRTRAWDQNRWFNMAAFNERLAKEFSTTKKNFQVYCNKMLGRGQSSSNPEKAQQQKVEDERWKDFFVRTQAEHDDEVRAKEEERQRRAEEEARLPPPKLHPCANMTMGERVTYYENMFQYTLRHAQWVDSPKWRSLETPKQRQRKLAASSSSSSDSNNSSGSEEERTCSEEDSVCFSGVI